MNFDLEPEEYGDPDVLIGVILEALRVLLSEDDSQRQPSVVLPAPVRLRSGHGPEVIWTMNIFADRAIELMLDGDANSSMISKVIYMSKANSESSRQKSELNMIVIGQPFVGGGLTTRPLGNYQVDDKALQMDDLVKDIDHKSSLESHRYSKDEWLRRVDLAKESLKAAMDDTRAHAGTSWNHYLKIIDESRRMLDEFLIQNGSMLSAIAKRITRQLQAINNKERLIGTNLRDRLDGLVKVWRNYSDETTRNDLLNEQVTQKTDRFESLNEALGVLKSKIELRIRDLNDGGKLRELELAKERLKRESQELDVKVGLMLAADESWEEGRRIVW